MERAKERFWNREGVQSYSISLSLRGWYSSRSSVRSDRILLGALTNQLGLYAFSQRTFFGGGEKDGRRGPFDKNRVFFFSSSPRNKKNSCAYITVPDFLNRKWESLYIHTHTSIGKCTIKTTNQQQHVACVVKVVFYYKTFFWWCTEYTRANPFLTPGSSIECPSIKRRFILHQKKKAGHSENCFFHPPPSATAH